MFLQYFNTVGLMTGRASGLLKVLHQLYVKLLLKIYGTHNNQK